MKRIRYLNSKELIFINYNQKPKRHPIVIDLENDQIWTKIPLKFQIKKRYKIKIEERRRRQPTKTPSFSFFFRLFLFYVLKHINKVTFFLNPFFSIVRSFLRFSYELLETFVIKIFYMNLQRNLWFIEKQCN